jgi:thiosulfate/3-mercaptopyruvate sulfurtransferase
MPRLTPFLLSGLLFGAVVCGTEPWTDNDLIQPGQAAKDLKSPLVIHVGFPVLYRSAHIAGSVFAGPGSKDEGITDLKKAVAGQPHTREILLYCGCCPWDKCPNIRPAFAALREMGFTRVKVIVLAANLKTDWIDKGYPTDKRTEAGQ